MGELPEDVVERAATLTRRARRTADESAAATYRRDRDELLAEHDFHARCKRVDDREVLVLHPAEWLVDGRVDVERVEDVSRGIEVSLSGPGDDAAWDAIDDHNRRLAAAVAAAHGDPHGETARALADFASNHYAKRIEALSAAELREFLEEYFPRNAFPSAAQRASVGESVRLVYEAADAEPPREP